MKNILLLLVVNLGGILFLYGQDATPSDQQRRAITALIDQYSLAREKSDTTLLKKILVDDIDQLVSTGEWRRGIRAAVEGMVRSSGNNPGTRTLRVENIRMLNSASAVADCRYEIENADGTARRMWSTFIVVAQKNVWKISAIRNMLPSGS